MAAGPRTGMLAMVDNRIVAFGGGVQQCRVVKVPGRHGLHCHLLFL